MRLHLYFARRYLATFLAVLAAFFLILSLFDLLEQIRRFGDRGAGASGASVAHLPQRAEIALPHPAARHDHRVDLPVPVARPVVRACRGARLGPGHRDDAARARGGAFLLGIGAVTVLNPMVAATLARYETVADDYRRGASTLSVTREGLWLRQADDNGQTVIRAHRASLDGTELFGATFLSFDGRAARGPDRGGAGDAGARRLGDRGRQDLAAQQRQSRTRRGQEPRLTLPSSLTPTRSSTASATPPPSRSGTCPPSSRGSRRRAFRRGSTGCSTRWSCRCRF
jgi:lipopolysaccharide export system permease protein